MTDCQSGERHGHKHRAAGAGDSSDLTPVDWYQLLRQCPIAPSTMDALFRRLSMAPFPVDWLPANQCRKSLDLLQRMKEEEKTLGQWVGLQLVRVRARALALVVVSFGMILAFAEAYRPPPPAPSPGRRFGGSGPPFVQNATEGETGIFAFPVDNLCGCTPPPYCYGALTECTALVWVGRQTAWDAQCCADETAARVPLQPKPNNKLP
eukprot:TRINITY_DN85999_c0_g1_i1.p2 TRINITY_DN85999_c0_g1~~TRINITY_DN85999_c0_g1_i1.p2  ORF type:complete len:208 (+),score=18.84 TRINITY_DN85999_c0_g1_i1:58-681(+)